MTFKEFCNENFSGIRFRSQDIKIAGKKFKISPNDAKEYLQEACNKYGPLPPNFKPPAKCHVVAQSRDFSEFDIVKSSTLIQSKIYESSQKDFLSWSKKEKPYEKALKSKTEHERWFKETGIKVPYKDVSGLNLIFSHSIGIYNGVVKKINNKNEKLRKRIDAKNKYNELKLNEENERNKNNPGFKPKEFVPKTFVPKTFVQESAFDENGFLLQKPGINNNLYCYKTCKVRSLTKDDLNKLMESNYDCVKDFVNYSYNPKEPILQFKHEDRLNIKEGQPGYIPEFQRSSVKFGHRIHRRFKDSLKKKQNSLLVLIEIPQSKDWVLVDARGLLRNARYRKLINKDASLNDLLNLFTRDPVIDTKTGIVTFCYIEGVVPVRTIKPSMGKNTAKVITKAAENGPVCIVGVDVGVINPYAVGIYSFENEKLSPPLLEFGTSLNHDLKFKSISKKVDQLLTECKENALNNIKDSSKQEILQIKNDTPELCRSRMFKDIGEININNWDQMSSFTHYISDYLISQGREKEAFFIPQTSTSRRVKKKKEQVKINDYSWYTKYKLRMSEETAEDFNAAKWDQQRSHPGYNKISLQKSEFCRSIVNEIVANAKKVSGCENVFLALEDLSLDNKFASGSGKRDVGWNNFHKHKKEGRWFMQSVSKAFMEQCENHGIPVCKVNKKYTSQTCPICGNCDKENRNKNTRDKFICTKCGIQLNSDIHVATRNIVNVAVTGQSLPGPCER